MYVATRVNMVIRAVCRSICGECFAHTPCKVCQNEASGDANTMCWVIAARSTGLQPSFPRLWQCIVFNCSDQIDHTMPARLFSGLVQTGAWTCLDEFNRINIEVLSVIAEQVGRVPVDRLCKFRTSAFRWDPHIERMLSRSARHLEAFKRFFPCVGSRHSHLHKENNKKYHLCLCQTADGTAERPLGGGDKGHVRGARTPSQGPSCGGDNESWIFRPDRASQ